MLSCSESYCVVSRSVTRMVTMEQVTRQPSVPERASLVTKSPPRRVELVEKADAVSRRRGAVAVADLPLPTERPQILHWDTKHTGFGVVVSRTGTRTFIVEGRVDGKKTRKAIGVDGRVSDLVALQPR